MDVPTRPRRSSIRFRRLESRLLTSFLLLAAIPSLLLTLVATGAVRWAVEKIQSPSIEESFWNSATLSRELRTRLVHDSETLFGRLPLRPPPTEEVAKVRAMLAGSRAAFAAWSLPDGRSVVVDVDERGGGSGHPRPEDWRALSVGEPADERRADAVRFFRTEATGTARCVGFRLDPATVHALDSAGEDYTRYRQLFLVEAVWQRALFVALAATFLATGIAAFVAARLTSRRIARPVTELARSADRLATGDLAHRADVRAEGEIAELVSSFNRMGGELEHSRDRIVRSERIAAWRDVARRLAHEIRNPLTPIRLALHRLNPRLPDDSATRECLSSITEEIGTLERLSAAFADFAKMPEARLEPIDLARIAASIVELHESATPGVDVRYEGPAELPVVGDRDLLRRAATNLVKNAAEALAGRKGTVRVRVRSADGRASLEVADDGPGIPPNIAASLALPGVTGKPGGSGLGLAMVERIAADHRGTLTWSTDASGTVFTLEFPAGTSAS